MNDRERGQLQPELQPPKWTVPLLHTALTVLPGPHSERCEGAAIVPLEHCRATADYLALVV